MKVFRLYNVEKRSGLGDGTRTVTFLPPTKVWLRGGAYPELRMDWFPPTAQWTTMRITMDYTAGEWEFLATNEEGNVLHSAAQDFGDAPKVVAKGGPFIDNFSALLHSTSRNHHGSSAHAPTFLGFRDCILGVE